MNRNLLIAVTAAFTAAAALWPRRSFAAIRPPSPGGGFVPGIPIDAVINVNADLPMTPPISFDTPAPPPPPLPPPVETMDQRLSAFLYAIRMSEHLPVNVVSGRDYTTFYGGRQFTNLSDHPVATGELQGVPLPAEWCRRAGFPGGVCVSTAAGAYQITLPTWREFRSKGEFLPDFSPRSQDAAAARILASLGALPLIERGDIPGAVQLAGRRWASLPGSTSGQPQKSMDYVLAQYGAGMRA